MRKITEQTFKIEMHREKNSIILRLFYDEIVMKTRCDAFENAMDDYFCDANKHHIAFLKCDVVGFLSSRHIFQSFT